MCQSGISLASYSGILVPLFVTKIPNDDENSQFMKSLFTLVTLGIGEIIASLFIGLIIDKYREKPKIATHLVLISILAQTIMVVYFIGWGTFGFSAHLLSFLWGV